MKRVIFIFAAFIVLSGISSCGKDKLDSPPAGGSDPNLKVNFSIDSLQARYNANNGNNYTITDDLIISAIVVGDDSSGSLYKQLAIEDSTGGIMLQIASTYLYNTYPVGRRIFVKLKGLIVTQKKGLIEICAYINPDGSAGGIPTASISQYIFPGKWGIYVKPILTNMMDFNNNYNTLQSELLEFDNVEFSTPSRHIPFATGYGIQLDDCTGNNTVVYTTSYAYFAQQLSPSGNGKFICLGSVYSGSGQLIIRDPSDLSLNGPNCGSQNGIPISQIRGEYAGSPVILPAGTAISGVVISDYTDGNTPANNLFIEDATGGIQIRFTGQHSFAVGSNLTISLAGDSLINVNGGLVVSSVAVSNAAPNGGTASATIHTATVAQVNASAAAWESTLVQISNATIGGGTGNTYSGMHTVNDGTATATLFTASTANFAANLFPTTPVTVTAILEQNNGAQLSIRSTADVH